MTDALHAWVLIYAAPDLPGQWIAHVLDLDVVTQGRSPEHAVEMATEATRLALESTDRRQAPDEEWQRLFDVVRSGEQVTDLDSVPGLETGVVRISVADDASPVMSLAKRAA